ncbi:hypothetical protein [Cellulomonas endophytica]|uniref:hypothetical protein n=1 Tax=Cellulomonas endophytica TaxID=2494735 RepID=UPI001012B4BE|nr:hypothetical protein [Cellulomonas endophytica]
MPPEPVAPEPAAADPAREPTAPVAAPASPAVPEAGPPRSAEHPEPVEDPEPSERAVPSEEALLQVAEPARVRRAPRPGRFVLAGVLVGVLLGLVLSFFGSTSAAEGGGAFPLLRGSGGARAWLVLAGALLGATAGGVAHVVAERRSDRAAGIPPRPRGPRRRRRGRA